MYEDTKNVRYWITAVNSGEKLDVDCTVPSSSDVHPFISCSLHIPYDMGEERDDGSEYCDGLGGLSMTLDASDWLAHHMPSLSDSGSDSTATSAISDSDSKAQIIDIAWDSPWYRPPQVNSPMSFSPLHDSHSCACSPDVRQAMAQQDLLLDLFHEELRRIIPNGDDYDSAWLDDVDPDLVLSPVESYEELCWRSSVSERHMTIERQRRSLPDVPVGYGDQLDSTF
ncbi:hypothetical protein K503DRAFT_785744 [Rhizopogon vinicolor AM-OR11-026]|uniref:Uncharacterized protein n=1 Tax=Rhizopogon vinicolor AM-OR11-026 TaxID=1314800 RepID=A0A1B7MPC0_9AGAM|nr:hypothetical protein K503DRAFT_785744 [Rhizopogon vinicolor AM-OR11-026]